MRYPARIYGILISLAAFGCNTAPVPDLQPEEAAQIISHAPEFRRYARLLRVESVVHDKGSMYHFSFGEFKFAFLDSPSGTPPIQARVQFQYQEGKWYLEKFDYGCPRHCRVITVHDGPDRKH